MSQTPVAREDQASQTAWPPLRIGLYSVLIVMVLVLVFLISRDSASRRAAPPMPADTTMVTPAN